MKKLAVTFAALGLMAMTAPAFADCDTACAVAMDAAKAAKAAEHVAHLEAKAAAIGTAKADGTLTHKERDMAIHQAKRASDVAHRAEEKEFKAAKQAAHEL